jgi:splicing factor 1
MATGANSTPLGRLHPVLAGKSGVGPIGNAANSDLRSHIEAAKRAAEIAASNLDLNRKKKKKSRWAQDEARTIIPGMPTSIPINMPEKEQKVYLMTIQVEELSRKLRTGDLGIPLHPEDRSPSPEPVYDHQGKRMNTREYRTRKKLEDERHRLVLELQEINPEYKPPVDYKYVTSSTSRRDTFIIDFTEHQL